MFGEEICENFRFDIDFGQKKMSSFYRVLFQLLRCFMKEKKIVFLLKKNR